MCCGMVSVQAQLLPARLQWSGEELPLSVYQLAKGIELDSLQWLDLVQQQVQVWQADGYLEASGSVTASADAWLLLFTTGVRWQWIDVTRGNVPEEWLREIGWRSFRPEGSPVRPRLVTDLLDRLVQYGENNGYPFVSAGLDSVVEFEKGHCSAALQVDRGPFITMDTLQMVGDVSVSQSYMQALLGIREGDPYSEALIQQMPRRIGESTFMRVAKAPEVLFIQNKALVRLYVEPVKASTFNFLIGILPNSDQQGGRLLVNGEATLRLSNPFGGGRNILLDWKNLQPRSPQVRMSLDWPHIAGSSIGADGQFHLFKRDTFFVEIEGAAGIRYALTDGGYLKAFVSNRTSNLIYVDTTAIRQSGQLPDRLDIRSNLLGIAYYRNQLDYRFNPRRGWQLSFSLSGGRRTVRPNANILSLSDASADYQAQYDSINTSATAGKVEVWFDKFWPIGRRSTVLTGYRSGWMYAATLWSNELFRIGGSHLLRGFDEESLLASLYQVMTIEYRFLLSRNAWFACFGDMAYMRNDAAGALLREYWPAGVGAGLALETGAGVFEVSYALGRLNRDNPFQLRKARVHLGFVSYF